MGELGVTDVALNPVEERTVCCPSQFVSHKPRLAPDRGEWLLTGAMKYNVYCTSYLQPLRLHRSPSLPKGLCGLWMWAQC